jgi:hypothetical protein
MLKLTLFIGFVGCLLLLPGILEAQNVAQLRCGQNVNCNDKNAVLNAMANAHDTMSRSNSPIVRAYQKQCADAYYRVRDLHNMIPINAGIMQPQISVCNAGLYEMRR